MKPTASRLECTLRVIILLKKVYSIPHEIADSCVVIIVVPSASRKDIWICRVGGGRFGLARVMKTNVEGCSFKVSVERSFERLSSPGAVDGVAMINEME